MKKSPVLVLDEATAFADPENEHLIQKALNALIADKTVIMIAHRLSTIRNADQILVMKDAVLQDCAPHQVLMERSPVYRSMVDANRRRDRWTVRGKEEERCKD